MVGGPPSYTQPPHILAWGELGMEDAPLPTTLGDPPYIYIVVETWVDLSSMVPYYTGSLGEDPG